MDGLDSLQIGVLIASGVSLAMCVCLCLCAKKCSGEERSLKEKEIELERFLDNKSEKRKQERLDKENSKTKPAVTNKSGDVYVQVASGDDSKVKSAPAKKAAKVTSTAAFYQPLSSQTPLASPASSGTEGIPLIQLNTHDFKF